MIRLGTRGSELALAQSSRVAERLREGGDEVALVVIKTSGDASDRPFRELEGKAFFTRELDDALLAREVDLAVHSLKDLPTDDPDGLRTICVLPRADPRDVLLLRRDLPLERGARGRPALRPGTTVGTSSARRFAQIAHAFPGVRVADLRGNVPTRIAKLRRREFDGIVIAAAGIERLGLDLGDLARIDLEPPEFLPAPGQGVLAARVRAGDDALAERLAALTDRDAGDCARAERGVLASLEGGCSLPLGALARRAGAGLVLDVALAQHGGIRRIRVRAAAPSDAAESAVRALRSTPTLLLTRPEGLDDPLASALAAEGFPVVRQPAIRFERAPLGEEARELLADLARFDAIALTSRHAAREFGALAGVVGSARARLPAIAAVGEATAEEARRAGLDVTIVGSGEGAAALAHELIRCLERGARVLHPGPAEPSPDLARELSAAGIEVVPLALYSTLANAGDPPLPSGALIAVVSSPSAARALLDRGSIRAALRGGPGGETPLRLVAGGAATAAELSRLGAPAAAVARTPSPHDVRAALAELLEPETPSLSPPPLEPEVLP